MKKLFNTEMIRQIIVYSCSLMIAIAVYMLFSRLTIILDHLKSLLNILLPFILGIVFAFILYRPQAWIERKLKHTTSNLSDSQIRVISSAAVFLLTLIVIVALLYFLIPAIISSLQVLLSNIGIYGNNLYELILKITKSLNINQDDISAFIEQLNLTTKLTTYISQSIPKIANFSYGFVTGTLDVLFAFVVGLYILIDHEILQKMIKKLTYAILSEETSNVLNTWVIDAKTVFQKYIVGSLMDAGIMGIIAYIGMLVLKIPYAPLIGIVIGVTNVIPMFGPFIGAIPVAILLLLIQPIYCVEFVIYICIIQQIDGNVFKPLILGDQLGINGFWILFSVTVGGGLFGLVGMFLGVPVFALIYQSIKRHTERRLYEKEIDIDNM